MTNEEKSAAALRQARYRARLKEKREEEFLRNGSGLPFRFLEPDSGRVVLEATIRPDGSPLVRLLDPASGNTAAMLTFKPRKGGGLTLCNQEGKPTVTLTAEGHLFRLGPGGTVEQVF